MTSHHYPKCKTGVNPRYTHFTPVLNFCLRSVWSEQGLVSKWIITKAGKTKVQTLDSQVQTVDAQDPIKYLGKAHESHAQGAVRRILALGSIQFLLSAELLAAEGSTDFAK